jgi:hypothetical protein
MKMSIENDYLDVLQNIEAIIVMIYREHAELSDYEVDKALVALIQTYRHETSGKTEVKPVGDLAMLIYEQVAAICNWRLGRTTMTDKQGNALSMPGPLSTDTVILCLKRLRKSVDTWTKQGGRQGYLNYIAQFL